MSNYVKDLRIQTTHVSRAYLNTQKICEEIYNYITKLCSGILGCNYRHTSVKVVSDVYPGMDISRVLFS